MVDDLATPPVRFAAALVCWLALPIPATGCGPGESEGVASALAGAHELDSGLRVEVAPGTIRRRSERPTVWFSSPGATLTLEADAQDPPDVDVRLANLPPDATLQTDTVRELSSSRHPRCPDRSTETIDCSEQSPPICASPDLVSEETPPTVATLSVDLPACREIVYRIERPRPETEALRVALAGPDVGPSAVSRAADVAAGASARFLVLTGDHADRSSEAGVERLADATRGLPLPVVLLPGERELVGGALTQIRRRFGPTALDWMATGPSGQFDGDVQMVTFGSPRQSLEVEGPERLAGRLDRLGRSVPMMALTHTPPLDPNSVRDRGFRSRIEGTRVLSTLADGPPDLLVAGHLPTSERTNYGSLPVVVGGGADVTLVDLRPTAGDGLELDVRRRSL